MKYLLVFVLFTLAISGQATQRKDSDLVAPQGMIDKINQIQDSWIASSDWVGQMTIAEAKRKAHLYQEPRDFPKHDWGALLDYLSIPASFDSRTQWPDCTHPIQTDEYCTGDYAYGPTDAFSDELCIASNKTINVTLSPGYIIYCDNQSYGCSGGYPGNTWAFLKNKGTPTAICVPHTPAETDNPCPSKCISGEPLQLYKAASVKSYYGVSAIQAAVLANGPVEVEMNLYDDFYTYKGGIYKHATGDFEGELSVKLIGWGNQNGKKYWICANSWGTKWGLNGYFWIEFGQCAIDEQAISGTPST